MTASPVTIDPEVLTRLELAVDAAGDLPPECELCQAPATCWFITLPCGCRHALCETHRIVSARKYQVFLINHEQTKCLACLTGINGYTAVEAP
jgi:hypothetical protein